jgi:hypothetical protein
MTKYKSKKHTTEKKQSRREEQRHSDKKRRRYQENVENHIVKKTDSSEISQMMISDDFSLFTLKSIIISKRILHHIVISYLKFATAELSRKLTKTCRRNRMKKSKEMRRMNQLTHFIDEIFRNEYEFNTSDHIMQRITSFTLINAHSDIETIDSTIFNLIEILDLSQVKENSISNSQIINVIFDLEDFLFDLKKIIFERDEIEKEIFIEQVRSNSQLKRIVLASFNENETIMRRVIEYDSQEFKIATKRVEYKTYRETSLKFKDIIYRKE